jgi:signal transduction histidine kinase/DNA-binding response OmpR family regulator
MLREADFDSAIVVDIHSLVSALREGSGFAVITEEALHGADLRELSRFIAEQEEWSDFPFVILTGKGGGLERNPAAVRLLETLGNVTFLERPFHPTTLVSLARAAKRARMRQYEARARLAEIREARQRMQVALSAGKLGAWSVEFKTKQLTVSPEGKAHYGRRAYDPFTLADLFSSIDPEDRERARADIDTAIKTGADYDVEYRCVWPDGSQHWLHVNGRLERNARGNPVRMVGVTQDVTARRQNEDRRAALLALGDGLRNLTDPEAMSFLAAETLGKTMNVSRAGYGIIDRAAETILIGRDWNQPGTTSLAGKLNFRDYGSYIDNLKRGETVAIDDARTDPRTAATSPVLEAIHARAVLNMPLVDHGNFVALLYLNHRDARRWTDADLTFVHQVADRTEAAIERRQAEASLAELAESLERQVIERTRESEAAQEQLRQAQKMEAVGQLTGGLAHDFNNMLTGVSGGLELASHRIQQGRLGEVDKYLEMAREGTKRAAALTHRLLAFSRRQSLDPTPTDIGSLVAGMTEFLQRSVGPAIDLEVSQAPGVWTTLIDANQLENALLNLCLNARDAMATGGRITIRTNNRHIEEGTADGLDLTAGDFVMLAVSDTGTGMAPETIDRVFDPFFTTKPIGEGTGLGLSMIYGFVRQSGGAVRIRSELNEGSTVELLFPRNLGAADTLPSSTDQPDIAIRTSGETVLVVDDEIIIRALITDLLEDLGCRAIEAGDGPEGLRLLETQDRVDLLITDVGLPNGINGRQLADAARLGRPDLKVLFITGYAESEFLGERKLEPGMHLLTKPFEIDALAARIRDLLGYPSKPRDQLGPPPRGEA